MESDEAVLLVLWIVFFAGCLILAGTFLLCEVCG